jgi:hypothetical protein
MLPSRQRHLAAFDAATWRVDQMDLPKGSATPQLTTRARWWPGLGEVVDAPRAMPVWCFVGLSLVCAGAMVWSGILSARDCRVEPIPLALGRQSEVPIALPANRPCTILVKAGSTPLDDITIDAPPQHGTLVLRGRTGVVYRPGPGFKGSDAFAFSLHGRSSAAAGIAAIQVRAVVE